MVTIVNYFDTELVVCRTTERSEYASLRSRTSASVSQTASL